MHSVYTYICRIVVYKGSSFSFPSQDMYAHEVPVVLDPIQPSMLYNKDPLEEEEEEEEEEVGLGHQCDSL